MKENSACHSIPVPDSIMTSEEIPRVESPSEPDLTADSVDELHRAGDPALHDLKGKTARGALVSTLAKA